MSSSKSRAMAALIDRRTSVMAATKSAVVAGLWVPPSDRSNAAWAAFLAANSMSAARLGCRRPSQHPGSLAVDARRDGADDLLADLRHERGLSRRPRGQHFCERERRLHVSLLAGSP
jgi:hypothetical protein